MRTGDTNSENTSEDKDTKDKTIEWDSEVLMDEPGRRIAWRSIGGESDNAGEVVFELRPAVAAQSSPCCRCFAWESFKSVGDVRRS